MTERTYGSNTTVVTEYQLKPNNIPSQIFDRTDFLNPTIVMVGAHDGVHGEQYGLMKFLDNLEEFNLYLIEPVKEFFDELFEVYGKFGDKVKYLNYAISEISGEIRMIDQGIMSKIGDGNIFAKSKTWEEFINENNINDIDILILDCEGYEFNILKQIDYSKTNIKSIRYEYYWCNNQMGMDNHLINNGFSIEKDLTDPVANKVAFIQ